MNSVLYFAYNCKLSVLSVLAVLFILNTALTLGITKDMDRKFLASVVLKIQMSYIVSLVYRLCLVLLVLIILVSTGHYMTWY
jgi:hypothetical protein